MEKPVKQRIKKVLSSKRVSITALCKAIGVPQPTLNRQINTDAPMTLTNILLILDYFSDVSVTWLLTGEGSMLSDNNYKLENNSKTEEKTVLSKNDDLLHKMYSDLHNELGQKNNELQELKNELKELREENKKLVKEIRALEKNSAITNSPTTNSDSHAETVQKERSSSRISGSSVQPDAPTIK